MNIVFLLKYLKKTKVYIIMAFVLISNPLTISAFQANFSPFISMSEEYTSNIVLSSHNVEYDYITSISPGFTINMVDKKNGALITYKPSFVYYSRYADYDTVRQSAQFSGWSSPWKNTRITLDNSFLLTEDPLEDDYFLDTGETIGDPDTSIRKTREEYYTNTTSLNLAHQFGAANHLQISTIYRILENDDPLKDDTKEWNPSIGLKYGILPGINIDTDISFKKNKYSRRVDPADDRETWEGSVRINKVFAQHLTSYISYKHTIVEYDGEDEDYKVYEPLIGINYTIAENTYINIGVGYFIQDREKSSGEKGLAIDGDIGKTFEFKRGAINLTGSTGQDSSDFGSVINGFSRYYQIAGSGNYNLTERLSANAIFTFREEKYTDLDDTKTDETTRFNAGINYVPVMWLNLGLHYSYNTVNSTESYDEYDENRVTFIITMAPSKHYRLIK